MLYTKQRLLFNLLVIFAGFSLGYITKEYFFTKPCPDCICPECPPQNVTNLIINNEKLKVKGGSTLDLTNILSDNKVVQKSDSTVKDTTKKKGILRKIFKKK